MVALSELKLKENSKHDEVVMYQNMLHAREIYIYIYIYICINQLENHFTVPNYANCGISDYKTDSRTNDD